MFVILLSKLAEGKRFLRAARKQALLAETKCMGGTKRLMTAEEFDNYPFEEDKRYELDEGEFIEMTRPAYRHNRVLTNLILALGNYLRVMRVGDLLISENLYALGPSIRRGSDGQ
jgi:Uma2 family endonuclease